VRLSELSLKGRVAVVTGGGQGIGRAISLGLAEAGAAVVIADIDPAAGAGLAGRITAAGQRSIAVPMDATDNAQISDMVARTMDTFGQIDVLVNNAGGASGPGFRIGRVTRISEKDWDDTIRINLKSVFLCTRAVAPLMLERKSGSIINMASITGQFPWAGLPAYSAAKAAVISLTQSLAMELAPHVRVNALAPGLVETARTSKNRTAARLESLLTNVPLGRQGQPEEIADIAVYLASDVAAWMTGTIVNCNGGQVWMAEDGRPNFRDRPSGN
jgi:3-oxoacyl-[acyl-carrier protein] reductase